MNIAYAYRTLEYCIFIFFLCDFITSIDKIRENGFELTKKRSRRYPAKTITDADYADDLAILANTPNEAKTLLHSLEWAAIGSGLHVNAHKTEYMCFNQAGDISTLEGTSLKLVDKFTYLGSSVSSTEKDLKTRPHESDILANIVIMIINCGLVHRILVGIKPYVKQTYKFIMVLLDC